MKRRSLQTSFDAGELDPTVWGRSDVSVFARGAAEMRNLRVRWGGAVERRPGTVHEASLSTIQQLVGLDFDDDESVVISLMEAGTIVARDRDTGTIAAATGGKWTAAMLGEINWAASGNTLVLTHPDMPPQRILRTGYLAFSISDFAFVSDQSNVVWQPHYNFAAADVTLRPSDYAGSVTVTTSSSVFSAGHVGKRIRWKAVNGIPGEMEVSSIVSSSTIIASVVNAPLPPGGDPIPTVFRWATSTAFAKDQVCYNSSAQRYFTCTTAGTSSSIGSGPSATSGSISDGTCVWTFLEPDASLDWSEQTFSSIRGWPRAVTFFEQRTVFGGMKNRPQGITTSMTGDYFRFDVGTGQADESVDVDLAGDEIPEVRHLVSSRDLHIFTSSGEFVVRSSPSQPLTPATFSAKKQTPFSARRNCRPVIFDGATVYAQNRADVIREFIYDDSQGGYTSNALSLLASSLIREPVAMAAVRGKTGRPESYLFVVNGDGTCAVLNTVRDQNVLNWSLWEMGDGAEFRDVVVVGGEVWFAVWYGGVMRLERLAEDAEAVSLDGATILTASTISTAWTSTLFSGRTVHVRSGNWYLGSQTVGASGSITTEIAVASIQVGRNYTPTLKALPLNLIVAGQPWANEVKRLAAVTLDLYRTLAVEVDGQKLNVMGAQDDFSVPPTPVTRRERFRLLGYDRTIQPTITQSEPLPLTIRSMTVDVGT